MVKRVSKQNKKLVTAIVLLVVILVIALAITYALRPELFQAKISPQSALEVRFLDVGQGDCIVLKFPDGKNMLVDAGGTETRDGTEAKDKILNSLKSLGITTIDYLLLTHPDADHSAFIDDVIYDTEVKNFYFPAILPDKIYGDYEPTATYKNVYKAMQEETGATLTQNVGKVLVASGDYTVTNYSFPETDYAMRASENINSISPITLVTYAGRTVALTGDAVGTTDENFKNMATAVEADIDFLKVAHHGSNSYGSNSADFISFTDPEYAFISCGVNDYGHPADRVMERFADYRDNKNGLLDDADGIQNVYVTRETGDVVLTIDNDGVFEITCENESGKITYAITANNPQSSNIARELALPRELYTVFA